MRVVPWDEMQISTATGSFGLTRGLQHIDLLAPKRAVSSACVHRLYDRDFAITGISNWPGPDIGFSCRIAVIGSAQVSMQYSSQ